MNCGILQKLRCVPQDRLNHFALEQTGDRAHSDWQVWTPDPAATPKGMSITGRQGPNAGKAFPAIYDLGEDTLRICHDLSGVKRPAEFKTRPGAKLFLVTYRRQKSWAAGQILFDNS